MTPAIVILALLGLIGCVLILWAIAPEFGREEPTYRTTTYR